MLDRRNFLQSITGLMTMPILPPTPSNLPQKIGLHDLDFYFFRVGIIVISVKRNSETLWDISFDIWGCWNPTPRLKEVIEGAGLQTEWQVQPAIEFRSLVAQVHTDPDELLARIRQAIARCPQADLYVDPYLGDSGTYKGTGQG